MHIVRKNLLNSIMKINSDINILGGLKDFELIRYFLKSNKNVDSDNTSTSVRTEKSVRRFEKAIVSTFISFKNEETERLFSGYFLNEEISNDYLILLFWNASVNNDLLNYLNLQIFFPAFYSGRLILQPDEISACLNDLRSDEPKLKNWSKNTTETTASKYLTLLKKFNLLEGSQKKSIKHPFLSDKMFVYLVFWILSVENQTNILKSSWLPYSFSEKEFFIERILQNRFSKFWEVDYTGDKMRIKNLIEYGDIYDNDTKS